MYVKKKSWKPIIVRRAKFLDVPLARLLHIKKVIGNIRYSIIFGRPGSSVLGCQSKIFQPSGIINKSLSLCSRVDLLAILARNVFLGCSSKEQLYLHSGEIVFLSGSAMVVVEESLHLWDPGNQEGAYWRRCFSLCCVNCVVFISGGH